MNNVNYQFFFQNLIKDFYADDTALVGLLSSGKEHQYLDAVAQFVRQCDKDDLSLNVQKTKEMIVDMRKCSAHTLVTIKSEQVETVKQYKYLGITVQSDLKWDQHIQCQVKKASQRLYHLRKLREFQLKKEIMQLFYTSCVQSVILFGCTVWSGGCTGREANMINQIERTASKVIGNDHQVEPWKEIADRQVVKRAKNIMRDENHPLAKNFAMLPSNRRLRQVKVRTERFRKTFVPNSICLLNSRL